MKDRHGNKLKQGDLLRTNGGRDKMRILEIDEHDTAIVRVNDRTWKMNQATMRRTHWEKVKHA